jgi:hypothetical protein
MVVLLGIMVLGGLLGGWVSFLLEEKPADGKPRWGWFRSLWVGLGASFLVPLFLHVLSSDLVKDILAGPAKYAPGVHDAKGLVFGGFCLLAAISARRFISTLTDSVMQMLKEVKAETKTLRKDVAESERESRKALAIARFGVGKDVAVSGQRASKTALTEADVKAGQESNDPWKGAFGRQAQANGRLLEAKIEQPDDADGWAALELTVRSTDATKPLDGSVQFFLHPTFKNDRPVVPVAGGVARLRLASWGAFTVGALCDGGATKLELDLAEHPDAQEPWKSR